MKVFSAECYGTNSNILELEILQYLKEGGSNHPGYQHISILQDSFTHKGPNGDHVCLIFKIMGESLSTFRGWFDERKIPTPLMQRFTKQLLQALEYVHERGVIHTGMFSSLPARSDFSMYQRITNKSDIQLRNIMIHIPDEQLINYAILHAANPVVLSESEEHHIIQTQSLRDIYFKKGFNPMELNIALSNWGVASVTNRQLTNEIQPLILRAPEVLLQAPSDEKVDIWNLGALIPELVFGQKMFCARNKSGKYEMGRHLEEMVGLCGAFPKSLLEKGDQVVTREIFYHKGNLNAKEVETVVGWEQRFESMDPKERGKFVAFIKRMLVLDPARRSSAKQLLEDDWWLKHDYDVDREASEEL